MALASPAARGRELNQQRAKEEARPGLSVPERQKEMQTSDPKVKPAASKVKKASHPKKKDDATLPMFGAVEPKEKS